MSIGPHEQMLRDARAGKLNDVPEFLDRKNGMTKDEIEAARDRATKRNNKSSGRRLKMTRDEQQSRSANLTDADKIAIAALKKAGAHKVSVIKQIGAKLRSETAKSPAKTVKKIVLPTAPRAGTVVTVEVPAEVSASTMTQVGPEKFVYDTPAASAPAQPETAEAAQPQESDMATKAKSVKSEKRLQSRSQRGRPRHAPQRLPRPRKRLQAGCRPGSKLEIIVGLLKRPEGCTMTDITKATGWKTMSFPQQAKAAGLTLKKEKDGSVTRYRAA